VRFTQSPLPGAKVVEIEAHEDERGLFARTWCKREFAEHGLAGEMVQASISRNLRRGTVRGMHLQLPPSQEAKLVRCTRGAIYDVIVDLRPGSKTYLWHFGIELTEHNHSALYIPPLMAHGFQTLADDSEVLYQMSDYHAPELAFGLRWNDPALGIRWPMVEGIIILPRDAEYPDFDPRTFAERVQAPAAQSDKQRP
jgi:dTDP-4-dehydrorhamnose 3,5-epimerase